MTTPVSPADDWTVGRLLEWTSKFFEERHCDSPRLDAEVLLAFVLGCSRIQLYTLYHDEVGTHDRTKYRELVKERSRGCPVAYLVGYREFYSRKFTVNRSVLIPRPETEVLVGEVVKFAKRFESPRILDIGVGSGAIAITLAKELAAAKCLAIDCSPEALVIAKQNAESLGVGDRIEFRQSDVASALTDSDQFEIIASNPPYIISSDVAGLPTDVRDYEPRLALDGGSDGFTIVRKILGSASRQLVADGRVFLEVGAGQADKFSSVLLDFPLLKLVEITRDYSGIPRVVHLVFTPA